MNQTEKKKALFIVSPFFGGASRMTVNIANLLDKSIFDIKFIVYGPQMAEIANYLPENAEVECLNIRNIWDFATLKLYHIFKNSHATHVFSSFTFINSRVALAAKMLGIKCILRSNNHLVHFKLIDKIFIKLFYRFANVIIAQQEEMQQELQNFLPRERNKIIVLHNLLNTQEIDRNLNEVNPYLNSDEIRFIWTGRVTQTKGYDILLKAFNIVKRRIPNAHLYLLGRYENDEFLKELQSFIEKHSLQNYVHFEGLVKNPHIWIKYAHCFVLPSRMEGLPNALVEAMYIGVPVVATDCIPIIRRMIDDGNNGYICQVENFEMMAEKMINALTLKNCKMIYKPSSPRDFQKLFS